jgi:predicted DCC family thiol-disulfide oxidoreductase YuxK
VSRGLLLYDADCGFCTRTARLVPRLGVTADIAAIQETDLAAYAVDAERAVTEMPFVDASGRVTYGHQAWAAALRTGPLPVRLLGRALGARIVAPLAARAYAWIAANRQRLPGGTPACALDDRPS